MTDMMPDTLCMKIIGLENEMPRLLLPDAFAMVSFAVMPFL
jgi:hypothetical protein